MLRIPVPRRISLPCSLIVNRTSRFIPQPIFKLSPSTPFHFHPIFHSFSIDVPKSKQIETQEKVDAAPAGLDSPLLFDTFAKFISIVNTKNKVAKTGLLLRNLIHSNKYKDSIIAFYYLGIQCLKRPDLQVTVTRDSIAYLLSTFVITHFETSALPEGAIFVGKELTPSKKEVDFFTNRQISYGRETGHESLIFKISKMMEIGSVSDVAVKVLSQRLNFIHSCQKTHQIVNPHLTVEDLLQHFIKLHQIQKSYAGMKDEHWAKKGTISKESHNEMMRILEMFITELEVKTYFDIVYYGKITPVTKAIFFKSLAQEFYASPVYNPQQEVSFEQVNALVSKLAAVKSNFEEVMKVLYNENLKESYASYCTSTEVSATIVPTTLNFYQRITVTKPKKLSVSTFESKRNLYPDVYLIQQFLYNAPFYQIFYHEQEGVIIHQGFVDSKLNRQVKNNHFLYEMVEQWVASMPQKPSSFLVLAQLYPDNGVGLGFKLSSWKQETMHNSKFYLVDLFQYNGKDFTNLLLEERLKQMEQNITWSEKVVMIKSFGKVDGHDPNKMMQRVEELLEQPNNTAIALRSCTQSFFNIKSFNMNYKDYLQITRTPMYAEMNVVILGLTVSKNTETFLVGTWNTQTNKYESIGVLYKGFSPEIINRLLERVLHHATPNNLPLEEYDVTNKSIYSTSFWFKPKVVLQVRGKVGFMRKNSCCHSFVEEHLNDPEMIKVQMNFNECSGLGLSNPTYLQMVGVFEDAQEAIPNITTSEEALDKFWKCYKSSSDFSTGGAMEMVEDEDEESSSSSSSSDEEKDKSSSSSSEGEEEDKVEKS